VKVSELLTWLHMAALDQMSESDIRDVLEDVLEDAPEQSSEAVERLLDAIEDQLDAEAIDPNALLAWPKQFAAVLPEQPAPTLVARIQEDCVVEDAADDSTQSPRLVRFISSLKSLVLDCEVSKNQALSELRSLEQEMAQAWDEYSTDPFDPESVSARSAAGHRFLRDGFVCWFEAFNLARDGQPEQALTAAREGDRLFRAVALWNDVSDVAETS
jgi:hypothetical protein